MGPQITIYEVSWGAAGLVFWLGGAWALARAARRHGRTAGSVLLASPLIAAFLALVGARLHAMLSSPAAVWAALSDGTFWLLTGSAGQRIAGGLLLAGAFLLWVVPAASGARLRGLEVLDAVVPICGISMAVGRIGCFLGGCCFGVPTSVPWAVRYPPGSAAYWNHVAQARLLDHGGWSLPVHPLSLYLGAAAALAGILALVVARRRPSPGTSLVTFVACMAASRLVLEPLRETRFMDTVPAQTEIDVVRLVLALIGAGWLLRRQSDDRPAKGSGPSSPGTPWRWIRRAVSP